MSERSFMSSPDPEGVDVQPGAQLRARSGAGEREHSDTIDFHDELTQLYEVNIAVSTREDCRVVTFCCLALMAALLTIGAASHGVIRHLVQSAPLGLALLLGLRRSGLTKWVALPCFVFWFLVMTAIWLYLLGWARMTSGTFSPIEIAMTLVVGLGSLTGMFRAFRMEGNLPPWLKTTALLLVTALQVAAFRVSLLPAIAHR